MISKAYTATTLGLQTLKVEVEVDATRGIPSLTIIGLPNKAVAEAKERITSALLNCQVKIKSRRTIVNLAPADIRKTSSALDLAIAVAIVQLYGLVKVDISSYLFLGELSLGGALKPIKGLLPIILAARKLGFKHIVIPRDNIPNIHWITDIKILPADSLLAVLAHLTLQKPLKPLSPTKLASPPEEATATIYSSIKGQFEAKRVLQLAAAGGHNFLFIGPPGTGKTLLCKALPELLPPLTSSQLLEVLSIHSLAHQSLSQLYQQRPFRSPHHTTTTTGILGGGTQLKIGELTLAHHGVLLLDELPEFSKKTLEGLRQPLEDQVVQLARLSGTVTYPAACILGATANPCPCGYYQSNTQPCRCSPHQILSYQKKFSGPLLDRIDLCCFASTLTPKDWQEPNPSTNVTAQIKTSIKEAHLTQQNRLKNTTQYLNAHLSPSQVNQFCQLSPAAQALLEKATINYKLSGRSLTKVKKVALTIADLETSSTITQAHIAEALQYRNQSWQYQV